MNDCGLTSSLIAAGWSAPDLLFNTYDGYDGKFLNFKFYDLTSNDVSKRIHVNISDKLLAQKKIDDHVRYLQPCAHTLNLIESWPGLLEKAFLKLRKDQQMGENVDDSKFDFDTYDVLDHFSPRDALYHILGLTADRIDLSTEKQELIESKIYSLCNWTPNNRIMSENFPLIYAIRTPATISSKKNFDDVEDPDPDIEPNHYYPILGMVDGDSLVLKNQLNDFTMDKKKMITGGVNILIKGEENHMVIEPQQCVFRVKITELAKYFSIMNFIHPDDLEPITRTYLESIKHGGK